MSVIDRIDDLIAKIESGDDEFLEELAKNYEDFLQNEKISELDRVTMQISLDTSDKIQNNSLHDKNFNTDKSTGKNLFEKQYKIYIDATKILNNKLDTLKAA
ncbi:hypothetical protein [Streptococcus oricebi]|uniref:Phage protein n=1 Tax=Streptococcus oricebi TaxID=1547447 RepID=A0ABS5B212_9STRE|nr:hypothetical protein [Streptococcus oricebi]MBP2622858.1 hypothetical protein [Streptococcus oricebi]